MGDNFDDFLEEDEIKKELLLHLKDNDGGAPERSEEINNFSQYACLGNNSYLPTSPSIKN